jgi:hypothetical protein
MPRQTQLTLYYRHKLIANPITQGFTETLVLAARAAEGAR